MKSGKHTKPMGRMNIMTWTPDFAEIADRLEPAWRKTRKEPKPWPTKPE